jgi:hypothetical protein
MRDVLEYDEDIINMEDVDERLESFKKLIMRCF